MSGLVDHILAALRAEMAKRTLHDLTWIDNERMAVAVAANEWAEAHGIARRVTVADVERVEVMAVGHIDYASKLAMHVADLVLGMVPHA